MTEDGDKFIPPFAVGKKRQAVSSSEGSAKRATVSSSGYPSKPPSLDKFLVQMENAMGSRFDPENQAATQSSAEEHGWPKEEKTVYLGGGNEEETELVCFKRKKSLRARPLEQKSPTKEQAGKAHGRKRRRPEVVQKEDREPLVILAWKRWCMFEGEEGEDEIEALINKRDERRRLERQNELLLREQVRRNAVRRSKGLVRENLICEEQEDHHAADKIKEVSMGRELHKLDNFEVTGSCTSKTDKSDVFHEALPVPTITTEEQTVQLVTEQGAAESNTPAKNDHKLGGFLGRQAVSLDIDIELASGDSKVGDGPDTTSFSWGADDTLGENVVAQSRAGSTQVLVSMDQQTDPSFFSAQGDSMVLDPAAEGNTANPNEEATPNESISHSTRTNICTEPQVYGADKGKGSCQGGTSSSGWLREEKIIDLDDEEDRRKGARLAGVAFSVGVSVNGAINGGPSNLTDSLSHLCASLPSSSRSVHDCGQSSDPTVPGIAEIQVIEEQGESTGGPSERAYRRGKHKVIELSDEEEDSNRVSIERRAISGQQSYHILDGQVNSNGDGGAATTSGAEISSVYLGGKFASGASQCLPEEGTRQGDHENTNRWTIESSGQLHASHSSDRHLENPEQVKTYGRRKRRQGKAIAGHDSGEEVLGPFTKPDDERSEDVDGHEELVGVAEEVEVCPMCNKELPRGISNTMLNAHVDLCLTAV